MPQFTLYVMLTDLCNMFLVAYCWPGLFVCYWPNLNIQVSCYMYFANCYLLPLIKGKSQVAVGVAPIDLANKSSESALSIFPLAIANCKEERQVYVSVLVHACKCGCRFN